MLASDPSQGNTWRVCLTLYFSQEEMNASKIGGLCSIDKTLNHRPQNSWTGKDVQIVNSRYGQQNLCRLLVDMLHDGQEAIDPSGFVVRLGREWKDILKDSGFDEDPAPNVKLWSAQRYP